jgi:glycosyltransferase involved in cell wall biosynthesis
MIAKNADSFSEFTVQLLKNKQTVFSLGLSARETVVERFSVDKMIAETIKYYQKIDDEF